MAASMTFTEITHGTVKKIKAVWVSAADGSVSGTTTKVYSGRLFGAITVPSGSAPPTDNYDIAINDSDSVDVALAALINRSATVTQYVAEASMAGCAHSALTIAITNAGNTKEGTVYLFIR